MVVDSSARMLEIARSKVNSDRVEFVRAELPEWNAPHGGFDLIVTNFFLDCFPADELERVVARLGELAAPAANWLLADFEIAPAGPARWRSRMIVSLLYQFFKLATGLKAGALVAPDTELEKAGFSRHRRITSEWGLLKSEWWRRGELLQTAAAVFMIPAGCRFDSRATTNPRATRRQAIAKLMKSIERGTGTRRCWG